MPELPSSLDCCNNLIKLPEIPERLEILHCTNNKLKYLPESLGDTCIYAQNNQLVDILDSFLNFKGHPMVISDYSFACNPVYDIIKKIKISQNILVICRI